MTTSEHALMWLYILIALSSVPANIISVQHQKYHVDNQQTPSEE